MIKLKEKLPKFVKVISHRELRGTDFLNRILERRTQLKL
jgi:hypothetical protein